MKLKLLPIILAVSLFLWAFTTAIVAQGEPPAPYAGVKNPFPWSDTSVQNVGEELYQRSCLGCHGIKGNNITDADFSSADFPERLEERPDFYFWILSEGRLNMGMPPFKSSLSEEERWQVLTYIWSLGATLPAEVTPTPAETTAGNAGVTLLLTVPQEAPSGQPLALQATVQDNQGKPIARAMVKFFLRLDFFTDGLMEIGEATTNNQGVATLEYTPRQTGDMAAVVHYQDVERAAPITLTGTDEPFYEAEAGLPAYPGRGVFLGPDSALELGEEGLAPTTALRIPGGLRAVLLLSYVATVMLVWGFYLRVMYLTLRISLVGKRGEIDIRLVPVIGIFVMTGIVTLLVLILITGPYSHFHLAP